MKVWLELLWKATVTLLVLMAVVVEGFSAYHRQPELDAENATALSRAVEFPTGDCSDSSSESGKRLMASTDGEEEQDSDPG